MRTVVSTMSFESQSKASFVSEESGFAKHTLFRDELNQRGAMV